MICDTETRAEWYREMARRLRVIAFDELNFCRREQMRALAEGFERFADGLAGQSNETLTAD